MTMSLSVGVASLLSSRAAPSERRVSEARILIVGTDTAHLEATLKDAGYTVLSAVSGRQAIAVAGELQPDLAVIDLGLEGPTSALDTVAGVSRERGLAVIYVTEESSPDPSRQVRETEPAGYLVKPLSARQVYLSVDAALRAHHRERCLIDHATLLESALDSADDRVVTDQENKLPATVQNVSRGALSDTVLESIADGVIVNDVTGTTVFANGAVREIFGNIPMNVDAEDKPAAYGLHYPDTLAVIPPHDLPTARALRGEETRSRDIFVRNEFRPDGLYISVKGSPMYDESGELIGSVIVMRDVTEFRATEDKLRETTDQLQTQNQTMEAIFNHISDGVVVADEKGNFLMFNPSAERIVGIGAIDTAPSEWSKRYGIFYPDKVTPMPAEDLPLMRAMSGESVDQQEVFIRNERIPKGAYISVSSRPMRDSEGRAQGGVAVFRDVTERVAADLALSQAFAQGRLEVVDTILHNIGNAINSVSVGMGSIAGELRSNEALRRLQALVRALETHRDDWPRYVAEDPQGRRVLPFVLALALDFKDQSDRLTRTVKRMNSRIEHIVEIIRTQRSFDDGAMVRKVVRLRRSISEAVKVLSESLRLRGIRVWIDCKQAPEEIWVQENKLHQTLVNLMKNSMEAIDASARLDAPSIRINCYRQHDHLIIDVIDNGIGIAETNNRLIFAAGYTTKEGGSGLGLHSAANFLIGSGGKLEVLSEGVGKGTTMRMTLRGWQHRTRKTETAI